MERKVRVIIFLSGLIGTFVLVRVALSLMPFRNFDIAGYNVHHLFTGIVILMGAMIAFVFELRHRFFVAIAGIGSGLVLDEIIYLIATDGSDRSYLTSVSFSGALIFVGLMTAVTLILYFFKL